VWPGEWGGWEGVAGLGGVRGESSISAGPEDMYVWNPAYLLWAGKNGAVKTERGRDLGGFRRPTWAEQFNLVLKVL